jgi:hypothetical protein
MMKAGVDLFYRLGAELAKAGVTEVQQRLIDAGDVSVLAEIFKRPTKPMLDPAGLGSVKLPDYVENIEYDFAPDGSLQPRKELDIGALQGKMLIPAYGDRTYAGGALRGIGDITFSDPVNMQGGNQFMRSAGGGIWASEVSPMTTKAQFAELLKNQDGEDVRLIYTAMAGQSGDFSKMMSSATMGMVEQSKITKKAAKEYDDWVKKGTGKDAPNDPNWPGILSPDARDYVNNNMTGSKRRLLWQEMDKDKYVKSGFPNVGVIRAAITERELLTAPNFATGRSIGTMDGAAREVKPRKGANTTDPTKLVFAPHDTYSHQVEGEYLGGLPQDVPGGMVWRDYFSSRRASGAKTSGDQRSFMMSPYNRQRVDQQMIDEISQYLESLKQLE